VRSRPPEKVRTFQCPSCGAPFGSQGTDRCEYCGQVTAGGRFDWSVETITLLHLEKRPPAVGSSGSTVAERGTDLPTVFHKQAGARWAELQRDDPATTQETLAGRLALIYSELNSAWTAGDLAGIRPFVSDGLFGYLRYWVEAYERQSLRNVLEGMRIVRWQMVKVVRDRYYDAITFRLWGTGRDYMVRKSPSSPMLGQRVSGDPNHDRDYSEYWTLLRGATVRGASRTDKSCPNCGAELAVNMAGECAHCGSKVASGDFDWVLSRIEQDDSYSG
jgi:ribosomal protein L37AE/L43A